MLASIASRQNIISLQIPKHNELNKSLFIRDIFDQKSQYYESSVGSNKQYTILRLYIWFSVICLHVEM